MREEKIAAGWIPGMKRKRTYRSLEQFDDNEERETAQQVAEDSRPRRRFKNDQRKQSKPCGRKQIHEPKKAILTNWFLPALWQQIEVAAKRAGKPWIGRRICEEAKKMNPKAFGRLTEQVVNRWMDKDAKRRGESKWRDTILRRVANGTAPGGETTRFGVLDSHPNVKKIINNQLRLFREAKMALTLVTIRGIIVAVIQKEAPDLFLRIRKDGTRFKCTDSWVRKYLHNLGWTERRATRAAQKLPDNLEEILTRAYLREAYVIRDYAVPAQLRVNTDQTQSRYQHGADMTWTLKGEKQVSTVGNDEKRAFTLVPSISASGDLLPMQAIYVGKTTASLPHPDSRGHNEAMKWGFRLCPSKTTTYWSTHETMHDLVDNIIAPYFDKVKEDMGLPNEQRSIWKIDC
ncbi:hypothetical protein H0H92_009493, partial [Tricholoma furcatifolium]